MQRLFLITIGLFCCVLGLAGLIIPIIPGFLFILAAGVCFAIAIPTFRTKLSRTPRFNRLFRRIDYTAHEPIWTRLRMGFWALLEAALPPRR